MSHLKGSIVEVQAEENCLAHALIIANAKLDKDSNYTAYRQHRKFRHVVQTLIGTSGIDLTDGAGITESVRFQERFR